MTTSKRALGPLERLFPMPATLVASGPLDNPGILTVAWINVVSSTPPSLVLGLRDTRNTLAHIQQTGCFSVNIPSTRLVEEVDFLGMASGKHGLNKLEAAGLSATAGAVTGAPLINECAYNLECVTGNVEMVGAYHVITAEIVGAYADEAVLESDEGNVVSMEALDPLIYIAGLREYRALGPKVADAYEVGKPLIQRHK